MNTFYYDRLRIPREIVADAYDGEDAIKGRVPSDGIECDGLDAYFYLPPSDREYREELKFANDRKRRTRYRTRLAYGVYDNFFKSIIDDVIGVMQTKTPTVQFRADGDLDASPRELVDLFYYGNSQNDGLKGLKQRLNFGQTLFGRYGLALDVAADRDGLSPRFVVSEYPATSILDGETIRDAFGASRLSWVLCDESYRRFDRVSKSRSTVERYRVFGLDSKGRYYQAVFDGNASEKWSSFDLDEPENSAADEFVYPTFKGKPLDVVPFSVCNVDRLGIDVWEAPPYLDVAKIAIANYRIDSIYKTALWNYASPTLVVKNISEGDELFLGDVLYLNGTATDAVDATLLETSGTGLAELRQAKEELKASLRFASIRDLFDGAGANSSGKALAIRADSGTAKIATIDKTGARALEEILCFAAAWIGMSRDEIGTNVKYEANASYLTDDFQIQSIVSLMQANASSGNPLLSRRQLYRLTNVASGDLLDEFDDNERQILEENSI